MNQLIDFMKNPFKLLTGVYRYDDETLTMTKVITKKGVTYLSLIFLLLLLTSFYVGTLVGNSHENEDSELDNELPLMSKYDIYLDNHMAWKDSAFKEYQVRADLYLSRPEFEGTPLKGEILALCARNAYDSTGIFLPLELALSQAQWESGMGRKGRSPKNNPFNVGENDSGTVLWFESTFEGTQEYYYRMCNDYLRCRSVKELLSNFVNCNGKRYATGLIYEEKVSGQYYAIKKWINQNRYNSDNE